MADPHIGGSLRPPVCAGSWYPGQADALRAAVDEYLAAGQPIDARVLGVVSPHAGLMYSGPVAGHAYAAVSRQHYDVVVLVGPSHFHAFEGVALWGPGAFATPLGTLSIDASLGAVLRQAASFVQESATVHGREHSLELQLPFLARLFPDVPILPLLVGRQRSATMSALGEALARVLQGREPLLVASSDLSHYQDRQTAARLDAVVIDHVERNDPDGLQASLEADSSHACGGGPIVAVMRAARGLGATGARVLRYADSGDVTGDTRQVVGYMSAALGEFADGAATARST
jgi:AmmeMemoRadiSam system protein B